MAINNKGDGVVGRDINNVNVTFINTIMIQTGLAKVILSVVQGKFGAEQYGATANTAVVVNNYIIILICTLLSSPPSSMIESFMPSVSPMPHTKFVFSSMDDLRPSPNRHMMEELQYPLCSARNEKELLVFP